MEFLIILLLLLLNGVFAMYEIALVSASKVRLERFSQQGRSSARRVLKQLKNPEQTLSTIQIGITLIGIVSGAFGGATIAEDLRPVIAAIPGCEPYAKELSVVLTIAAITYLSLIIGELVPKSMALSKPESYAMLLSAPIRVLTWLSFPFVWLLSASTRLVSKLLGVKMTEERPLTQEELKMVLRKSAEQGIIDRHETEMLRDVFRFSDKHVNELMTPRHEMVVLHDKDSKEAVLSTIKEHNFGKYLLVGAHRDDVLGIVSVKDVVLMLDSQETFDLRRIAHPALFLPESIYAKKAVELFKKNKSKFAVVVDEYGSTAGLVTLHDLTESIFGDILEENELDEPDVVKRQDGSLLVDGAMNLSDFMEEVNVASYDDIEDEGFTTVGGMAMFFIGRIPKAGDVFTYKHLRIEVVDMDAERVDKLLVYVLPEPTE